MIELINTILLMAVAYMVYGIRKDLNGIADEADNQQSDD